MRHHDHITGQFIGTLCTVCNLELIDIQLVFNWKFTKLKRFSPEGCGVIDYATYTLAPTRTRTDDRTKHTHVQMIVRSTHTYR